MTFHGNASGSCGNFVKGHCTWQQIMCVSVYANRHWACWNWVAVSQISGGAVRQSQHYIGVCARVSAERAANEPSKRAPRDVTKSIRYTSPTFSCSSARLWAKWRAERLSASVCFNKQPARPTVAALLLLRSRRVCLYKHITLNCVWVSECAPCVCCTYSCVPQTDLLN